MSGDIRGQAIKAATVHDLPVFQGSFRAEAGEMGSKLFFGAWRNQRHFGHSLSAGHMDKINGQIENLAGSGIGREMRGPWCCVRVMQLRLTIEPQEFRRDHQRRGT